MVRIVKVNADIKSSFKKGVQPLSDEEFSKLEKIVSKTTDFTKEIDFDEDSKVIFVQLLDKVEPRELKYGWAIPCILPDGRYTSFITKDEQEVNDLMELGGNYLAVVGKIVLVLDENDETKFVNIKNYRGCMVIEPKANKKLPKFS